MTTTAEKSTTPRTRPSRAETPGQAEKSEPVVAPINERQMRQLHALLRNHGITGDVGVHDYLSVMLGRDVASRKDLNVVDAARIIAHLETEPPLGGPPGSQLAAALVAFQAELPKVHKGNRAVVPTKTGGQYSYTYADLTDVTAAAIPALNRLGLSFTSRPRLTPSGGYELVGVLRHGPSGEYDEGSLPLFGREMQDLGGSLTYARRYLLGCMTGIVTDDDEDGAFTSSPERVVTVDPRETQAQAPPLPETRPLPRTDDPDALAATASILSDLSDIADRQEPSRDLAWITSKLRREAGGLTVDDLYGLDPAPLEALLHRWQGA